MLLKLDFPETIDKPVKPIKKKTHFKPIQPNNFHNCKIFSTYLKIFTTAKSTPIIFRSARDFYWSWNTTVAKQLRRGWEIFTASPRIC